MLKQLCWAGDGGPVSNAYIVHPVGIAAYSPTDYIFGEWVAHTIRRVTNGIVRRIAGTASRGGGYCCDGGPATSAYIVYPGHLSLDKDKQGFYFPGELQSRGFETSLQCALACTQLFSRVILPTQSTQTTESATSTRMAIFPRLQTSYTRMVSSPTA